MSLTQPNKSISRDALIQQALLHEELLARHAERSLRSYVEQAWPILEPGTRFLSNWHIDLICEYLEAVTAGEIQRLLITVPPRSMKSILTTILWPTWEWVREPSTRVICASYAESLALTHSLDRRRVIQSEWYQRHWGDRVRLAKDQNVKGEFQNGARGMMIATSVGGSITGKGGDRIIVDDLHNPQQAASDPVREAALAYFTQTLWTRLNNKKTGAIVVVMQRLHERDLAAVCLELGFTHLCLPATAETRIQIPFPRSPRVVVREAGEVLWPAREGPEELERVKQALGSAAYASQYQQTPAPPGGLIFHRDWFKYYTMPPPLTDVTISWDMTFKGTEHADNVVGLVAGRHKAHTYVLGRVKGRWTFTQSCQQVEMLASQYPGAPILIEEAANGAAIIDWLKGRLRGVVPIRPAGTKVERAHAIAPTVESGNVYLPDPRPNDTLLPERAWVDDFVHQLTVFPRGRYDDDVDAFTQLVRRLYRKRISIVVLP